MLAPQDRFTGRALEYAQARPGYPREVVGWLCTVCGLGPGCVVADVGAGTGIFTEMLLETGARVSAVEPNADMRQVMQEALGLNTSFSAVDGTAERTGMENNSVDMVVAAQAFHWFDVSATKTEFRRILKPDGWVALLWNDRRTTGTAFLEACERLLREHCPDYLHVVSRDPSEETLKDFLGRESFHAASACNEQLLNKGEFLDRLKSCSFFPAPEESGYETTIKAAKSVFDEHNTDGRVQILYDTRLFCGRLEESDSV